MAKSCKRKDGRIAQLDRVPGYEPGGRRFESSCAHHFLLQLKLIEKKPTKVGFFVPEINQSVDVDRVPGYEPDGQRFTLRRYVLRPPFSYISRH